MVACGVVFRFLFILPLMLLPVGASAYKKLSGAAARSYNWKMTALVGNNISLWEHQDFALYKYQDFSITSTGKDRLYFDDLFDKDGNPAQYVADTQLNANIGMHYIRYKAKDGLLHLKLVGTPGRTANLVQSDDETKLLSNKNFLMGVYVNGRYADRKVKITHTVRDVADVFVSNAGNAFGSSLSFVLKKGEAVLSLELGANCHRYDDGDSTDQSKYNDTWACHRFSFNSGAAVRSKELTYTLSDAPVDSSGGNRYKSTAIIEYYPRRFFPVVLGDGKEALIGVGSLTGAIDLTFSFA